MGAKNKYYTEDFKRQIIELHENGKTIKKLAGEYRLVEQTIYKWKKRYDIISKTEER